MGVKNLHSFLRKKIPNIYEKKSFEQLRDQTLAIDTSIFMCKYKSSLGKKFLSGFYTMIQKLVLYHINFIFILDGKAPPEKEKERESRVLTRRKVKQRVELIIEEYHQYLDDTNMDILEYKTLSSYIDTKKKRMERDVTVDDIHFWMFKLKKSLVSISVDDYDLLKKMFDMMNVHYLTSEDFQEAENLCVLLCKYEIVDGILTEDTDAIAYGTKKMYFNANFRNETVELLQLDKILEHLEITYEQLRDFCIMCGTDYNTNIPLIGPQKSFDLIQLHKSLDSISNHMDTTILDYKIVRNLFTCTRFEPPIQEVKSCDNCTFHDLEVKRFLFSNNIEKLY